MILQAELQNFKCFQKRSTFDFSKVNLLTGINGRGKSSLLQSLLVLSQSVLVNGDFNKLIINERLVELGNYDDIKNSETLRHENIHFNFMLRLPISEKVEIEYNENPEEPLVANLVNIECQTQNLEKDDFLQSFINLLKRIHFISADRLGPVPYVDKINLPDFIQVGTQGEHTINILSKSRDLPNVHDNLYLGEDSKSLIQQTTEWLSYIFDGAKIDIKGLEKESSVLYMLMNNRNNAYTYKPSNIGYGYSYVLPLIVTGLIAKPGDIIIIENPEAHLHPRAQSRISEFFTRVASCGIQVFIESHSEHILNGLRISALNPEIRIDYSDLAIHYFDENFEPFKLKMDEKGKIGNWPEGFFDQQEIDLAEIFKYSTKS